MAIDMYDNLDPPDFYTPADVADRLGLNEQTVRRIANRIGLLKRRGVWLFTDAEVRAIIERPDRRRRVPAIAAVREQNTGRGRLPPDPSPASPA